MVPSELHIADGLDCVQHFEFHRRIGWNQYIIITIVVIIIKLMLSGKQNNLPGIPLSSNFFQSKQMLTNIRDSHSAIRRKYSHQDASAFGKYRWSDNHHIQL
jgi:hypothetical protein